MDDSGGWFKRWRLVRRAGLPSFQKPSNPSSAYLQPDSILVGSPGFKENPLVVRMMHCCNIDLAPVFILPKTLELRFTLVRLPHPSRSCWEARMQWRARKYSGIVLFSRFRILNKDWIESCLYGWNLRIWVKEWDVR